jgi:hypothetical protein
MGGVATLHNIKSDQKLVCEVGSLLVLTKYVPLYIVKTGNIHSDLCYPARYVVSVDQNNIVLLLENVYETKISTGLDEKDYSHYGWCKVLYQENIYWLDGRHVNKNQARILELSSER